MAKNKRYDGTTNCWGRHKAYRVVDTRASQPRQIQEAAAKGWNDKTKVLAIWEGIISSVKTEMEAKHEWEEV